MWQQEGQMLTWATSSRGLLIWRLSLAVHGICKYRLVLAEPRDDQLSRQMEAHLFGELRKWQSMVKCDQGGIVRNDIYGHI